jgi:hypothetical protein
VEIGPGGGRWTRYLLGFETVYTVDYYEQLLREFSGNFGHCENVKLVKNNGTDFPGIAPNSIDYVLSLAVLFTSIRR